MKQNNILRSKIRGLILEELSSPMQDPRTNQIIQMLKDMEVDGETMEYILRQVGMEDQMSNQLVNNPAEYAASLKETSVRNAKFSTNKPARIKEFIIALNRLVDEYHAELYLNDGLFDAISMVIKYAQEEAMNLDEAKKDKEEIEVEEVPEEEIEDTPEEAPKQKISTDAVNPDIKDVQDALTQAQAAAEKLGDEKLLDQIGNTITFFTRAHISDKTNPINESYNFKLWNKIK
jgi:hypothetical protein